MDSRGVDKICLCYFGRANPEYYHVNNVEPPQDYEQGQLEKHGLLHGRERDAAGGSLHAALALRDPAAHAAGWPR